MQQALSFGVVGLRRFELDAARQHRGVLQVNSGDALRFVLDRSDYVILRAAVNRCYGRSCHPHRKKSNKVSWVIGAHHHDRAALAHLGLTQLRRHGVGCVAQLAVSQPAFFAVKRDSLSVAGTRFT